MISSVAIASNYTYPTYNNLASNATVTGSSQASPAQPLTAVIDGIISGYKNPGSGFNTAAEWASAGGGVGTWMKLTWKTPISVNLVVMYDRCVLFLRGCASS